MVFSNQPFHIHGAPTHLLPVYVADQRLVARVFLAHPASLRHVIFFARMKFRGFLHGFVLRVRVFRQLQQKSKNPRNSTVWFPFRD
jgi:hypothetical protein